MVEDPEDKYTKWDSEFPKCEGMYWFYGDPYMGQMGIDFTSDAKIEKKMFLVEVRKVSNGFIAVTNGRFMATKKFKKTEQREGYIGYWRNAEIPNPPVDREHIF